MPFEQKTDWDLVLKKAKEALQYFDDQGVKPTLRTLFYNLVSQNILGNTKSTYKGLSRKIVKARKDGVISWDALEDTARHVYGNMSDSCFGKEIVDNADEKLQEKLGDFNAEAILNDFFDYVVPWAHVSPWAKQPIVAEIWIEKEALAKTIQAWTENLKVNIRVNKGYSSWTFLYNNAQALQSVLEDHDEVIIYYLGDLDPSGVDMERFLKEALVYFALDSSRVKLKRLAITAAQVEEYHLPPKPEDAETLAKLKRDSRTAKYDRKYIVELDALVAYVPQEFKRLVREAIMDVWDRDLYNNLKREADEKNEEIQKLVDETKAKAKELLKAL